MWIWNPFTNRLDFVSNGVTSLNGETGAITLVAGTNIVITPSGNNLTIDGVASINQAQVLRLVSLRV